MLFVFGECVLDVERRELRRSGIVRPLEPKAFSVLMHLLTQRQRAVSKDELLATCWPHEFVTEAALTRCLKVIRQAVADDGVRQHVIKTLRGYGYRFVAAVEEHPTLPPASAARVPDSPLSQVDSPRRATATLHVPNRRASTPAVAPPRLADKLLAMRRAVEGERKQVTVLCTEIVGSSMLAEHLDPEDLQALIGGCFALLAEQVQRYEGTITQFTSDGLMAVFGAPIAHEDHAGRALHAALGMQGALREFQEDVERSLGVPLQMRLGLHTGTVVTGRIGDNRRMDYTVPSDTTHLAVRLQQMAPPGAIWVSEETYRVARDAFVWQAVGLMAVPGQPASIPVYAPLSPREARSRFEVRARQELTRFVGRASQLRRLLEACEQAEQGTGQVVSVVGEVGIGKSRLVYEFTQCLRQQGGRYTEGSCFTYGEGISYLPFLAIVRGLCGLTGTETEAAATAQLRQHLHTLGLDAPGVAPYLQHLLTLPVEDDVVPRLSPELVRQRTVEALKTLLLAEVRDRPGVLILEDVHWIDHASEEVLAALVEAMGESPLLLVLVYRPEYGYAWTNTAAHTQITLSRLPHASSAAVVRAILAKSYAAQVRLERLTPAQSQAMMQDLVGTTALPAEVEQLIITQADGNPLFVEELTRTLVESGALIREPEGYRLRAAPTALYLPATIQGVLLARLDRLPAALKTVLQAASVIGRVFSYAVLARVVSPGVGLDEALRQLEESEFLHPRSLTPQRELSFKHVLTQETVYQTLLRSQREDYHARVAQAIETLSAERREEAYEVLAHHYVRSDNRDKALEYLALANQKAAKVNAMTEAKQYFESAMALLDTLPDTEAYQRRRLELLVSQLAPMLLLMQFQEYYDLLLSYEATAVRLGRAGLLGALYGRIGICEWWFGRLAQAIATLTKAVALCDAAGNAEDAAQAYVILQWSHLYQGNYDKVLALKDHALQALEQRFDLRYYVWSLSAVSWAYTCLGRWEKAIAEGHRALRIGKEYADGSRVPLAAWVLCIAYTSQGDLAQACIYGELAVQQAPTPADRAWSEGQIAWAWCRVGEVHRGLQVLVRNAAAKRSVRFVWGELLGAVRLGEGYWLAGEYDNARQTLEALLEPAEQCGMQFLLASAHRFLGEIALATNPAQREAPLAAPHFERSIALLQQMGAENELALAYAGYGRLHQQHGDIMQARTYLTRALAIFERLGTLREPERIRQLLTLQGGAGHEAPA